MFIYWTNDNQVPYTILFNVERLMKTVSSKNQLLLLSFFPPREQFGIKNSILLYGNCQENA